MPLGLGCEKLSIDGEDRTAFPSLLLLDGVFRDLSRGRVGLRLGGVIKPV